MPTAQRMKKLKQVARQRQQGLIMVLEDIHDPHNAAAIVRTCEGLGIQDVYFIFEKEKRYNPRRVGKVSSSSANKWLTFTIFTSTKECFAALRKKGYTICVTALDAKAENLFTAHLRHEKIALVAGNEHRGVSAVALKHADRLLYLPMQGFVQSFNVSVSAALFLYEIVRQRRLANAKQPQGSLQKTRALMADFKKR